MVIDILAEKDKFLAVIKIKHPVLFQVKGIDKFLPHALVFADNTIQDMFDGWMEAKKDANKNIDPEHTELHTLYCDILKENERLIDVILTEARYCIFHYNNYFNNDPERSKRHRERAERLLNAIGLKFHDRGFNEPIPDGILDELTELSQKIGLYDMKESENHE